MNTLRFTENKNQTLKCTINTNNLELIKSLISIDGENDLTIKRINKGLIIFNDGFDYDFNYFKNSVKSLVSSLTKLN